MATYVYGFQGSVPFTAASGPSAPYAPVFGVSPDTASLDISIAVLDSAPDSPSWMFNPDAPGWMVMSRQSGGYTSQDSGSVPEGLPQIYVLSGMNEEYGSGATKMFTDIAQAYACAAAQASRTVMVIVAPDGASKWLNAEPFAATYQGTQITFPIGTTKSLATVITENAPAPDPSQWKELFIGQARALYGHNVESFKLCAEIIFTEKYRAEYPEPAEPLAPGFGPSPNADPASPL
jgi:hypothetical protein